MLKLTAVLSAAALCFAGTAQAAPLTTTLKDDVAVVGVESRPNPAGTIVGDAIGGAVLGAAVGGGVAFYNRYGTNNGNGNWGNWQRDVLVGAGIGLGVGLIVGGISAASNAGDHVMMTPATEQRDIGFSPAMGSYGGRF